MKDMDFDLILLLDCLLARSARFRGAIRANYRMVGSPEVILSSRPRD